MKELKKKIGQRIRKARFSLEMTQEKLAEEVDANPKYIGMLERGEKTPSLQMLDKMARTLGVPICFFLMDDDRKIIDEGVSPKQKKLIRRIYDLDPKQVEAISVVAETFGKYRPK